jgi:hypothetical protein
MMMEEEEETNVEPLSSLLELPAEVQAHIYSFLSSLPILLSLASVCKGFTSPPPLPSSSSSPPSPRL